eukprot:XP_011437468.1 PREDICTED: uncharacterized protein LOC105335342 [Crassostrea gigas]
MSRFSTSKTILKGWTLFVVHLISISSGYTPDNSSCDVSELEPGRLLRCTDRNNLPVTVAYDVPTGSSCDIICPYKEVKAWVTCDDGRWNDFYLQYCREAPSQNERRSRPKRWFRFRRIFRAIGRFFKCLFGSCSRRDNTPPSLTCPPNIQKTAVKLQTWQIVSWAEPTANDGRDGGITPTRQGRAPGSYFSSGVTTIGYYARDKSGNMARCSFTVTVNVVRCTWPSRVENGYFMCHPSDDARYGATCRFGCYPGYKLIGNTLLECLISGQWNNNPPYCEKKTCPTLLPAIGNLKYTCTDSNKFRSICTYSCATGYDITPGMSRVRVCTAFGTWRGSEPSCTDIEPPRMKGCQHTVYAFADRNSSTGVAMWSEPIAEDNHDNSVVVRKEGSVSPGDRLSAGNYKVVYKATDAAGNKAQSCITEVVVKILTCPTVYPTPFLSVVCPWGTKYGSQCEFFCDAGSVRNGSKVVVCEKSGSGSYGFWTFGERQPHCEVMEKCIETPNTPHNGALACDYWLGGKFCQMLCKQGYDVEIGKNTVDILVCGESGKWLPTGSLPLPDCARSFRADRGRLRMSATYYFTGDCTESAVQEEIKEKFIITLSTSAYRDACLVHAKECKAENVQVKCGQLARRKRSGDLRIDFDISAEFDNASFAESFARFRRHQSDIVDKIIEEKSSGILDFNISTYGVMEMKDIENFDVVLQCPERTVPSYKTTSCVECAAGTFFNTTTDTCEMCPRGSYQPIPGQISCLSCPFGQTTKSKGAQNMSQCIDGCQPGSWSPNGTPECSLCAVGSYSDVYGAAECKSCPGSKSTVEEGATNFSQCQDFDLRLTESGSQASVDIDAPDSTLVSIAFWFKRDIKSTDNVTIQLHDRDTGHMTFFIEIGSEAKMGNPREAKTASHIMEREKWSFYILKQNMNYTELYTDGTLTLRAGMTFVIPRRMKISLTGKGTVSRFNIWTNQSASYSMIADIAARCSSDDTGDLLSWKAFESTTGDNVFKQSPSECDDVDDCLSSPCQNGVCTDLIGGYECQCDFGFTGDNCEENIDDCVDHACENNATCVDGAANYTCDCLYGYKGELCEIAMVDGSWGEWGEWSSCSVTCGNGTQQRWRVCNDPAPDNGGLECPDNSTDSRPCILDSCPECNQLERLAHVNWTCTNDSENMNCSIECADGYDFDHEIKPYYMCGKDTFYLWDFQTDDNPDGKMPACLEIKDGKKLQVSYTASYKDLECNTTDKYADVRKNVPETVQLGLNNIECVSTGVCFLERVTVTDCSKRQKRSTTVTTAGIDVSLSCDPASHGTETCYTFLYAAVNELQLMAMNRTLDVDIQNIIYVIDAPNAQADSSVSCPTGMVPTQFYCIPCAPGRYYRNDQCLKCDFGTYQDLSGQLSCVECPDGTTTPGRESRSATECSIKYDTETDSSITVIVAVVTSVILIVIVTASLLTFRRFLSRGNNKDAKFSSTVFHIKPKQQECVSKPAFDNLQLSQKWKTRDSNLPGDIDNRGFVEDIDTTHLQ